MQDLVTTRRHHGTVKRALLWAAPVVAASTMIPAVAASAQPGRVRFIVADPSVNFGTFRPEWDVPVYRFASGNAQRTKASLPSSFIIRNDGSVPAENPTGQLTLTMRDYDTDYAPVGANQMKVTSPSSAVSIREERTPIGSREGSRFRVSYRGIIQPGQSVNVPLRYFVNPPFRNVTFNLLVSALADSPGGEVPGERSERMGHVPGFGGWL